MATPILDLAPVRAAIKATIAAVANMGSVHDYERFADKASGLQAQYKNAAQGGSRIYGWFVSRLRTGEVYEDIGRWIADVDWRIGGYMSLDDTDETEKKFDVQIELIRDAFRANDSLGLGAGYTLVIPSRGNQVGAQLELLDHVMFCGVLSHRAQLGLTTRIYF